MEQEVNEQAKLARLETEMWIIDPDFFNFDNKPDAAELNVAAIVSEGTNSSFNSQIHEQPNDPQDSGPLVLILSDDEDDLEDKTSFEPPELTAAQKEQDRQEMQAEIARQVEESIEQQRQELDEELQTLDAEV